MSSEDYTAEASRNYFASQTAYEALKSNARKAAKNDAPQTVKYTHGPL